MLFLPIHPSQPIDIWARHDSAAELIGLKFLTVRAVAWAMREEPDTDIEDIKKKFFWVSPSKFEKTLAKLYDTNMNVLLDQEGEYNA